MRNKMDIIFVALLFLFTISCNDGCIIAQFDKNITQRRIDCTFSVSDVPESECDTTLRQVFKLLDVNDEYVLIGSTECLYSLTPDLKYTTSLSVPQPEGSECTTLQLGDKTDLICKNYISSWFNTNTSDPTIFRVCGTNDARSPKCWNCDTSLSCTEDEKTVDFLPTDPIANVTALMTQVGSKYFIGGQESYYFGMSEVKHQIGRANVNSEDSDEELSTNADEEQVMYESVSFVGEPIEHGNFIYFFFRERAYENYFQPMTYSRVARVCKNDLGGETNPLTGQFTTYLKSRVICSCGNDFPMIYNEIQDVDIVTQDNDTIIYGLFTTVNSRASAVSAVCRYSLKEIEDLFNKDNRRGPSTDDDNVDQYPNLAWSKRPLFDGDTEYIRETCGKYEMGGNLDFYNHLLNFPLLNTNVANCGLGKMVNCTYRQLEGRMSHNALAVLQNVRGQQLTVSESSEERVQLYIGTNNREILEVEIKPNEALITDHIRLTTEEMSSDDIDDKWPYAITSLRTHNGFLYGNMDNCAFKLPPYTCRKIYDIIREGETVELTNHTQNISEAVTNFFTMFIAPIGTDMVPHFSGLFSDRICSGQRFSIAANKTEILHVSCRISTEYIAETERDICINNDTPVLKGSITIVSGERCEISDDYQSVFEKTINIDCTDIQYEWVSEVQEFDTKMAEHRYNLTQWNLHETDPTRTCPALYDGSGSSP